MHGALTDLYESNGNTGSRCRSSVCRVGYALTHTIRIAQVGFSLLALAIVAISLVVFQEGAQYLLGNSSIIRRLVLGSRYVEGAWIDAVFHEDELTSVALVSIRPDGDEIRLSGDLYSPSGNSIGLVRTDMVVTQWPVMKYKYTSMRSGAQMPPSQGYCEIQFDEQRRPPSRFYGYYSDLLRPYRCDVVGRRLKKAELLSLLTREGRMALVVGFVEEEEKSRPKPSASRLAGPAATLPVSAGRL